MKTTTSFLTLLAALLALFTAPLQAAPPVVSNLTAAQRIGTKLVDITYDITTDVSHVTVTLEISSDGGISWSVPAITVSGDIGPGVTSGTGKTIIWNAATDWDEQTTNQMKFRVTADDLLGPRISEFALIPGGSFMMGMTSGDTDSSAPSVTVSVSSFYMARYEVSKALWDTVRTWGLANGYTDLKVGGGKAASHPVHSITWYDMVKWCNARSEKEGLSPCYTAAGAVYRKSINNAVVCNWSANGYRLPTEAEWEKAARGGLNGKRFPWGDTINHDHANYNANGSSFSYDTSLYTDYTYHPAYATGSAPYSSPVGSFMANGYGLYDMAGNVSEWCWDWYSSSYYLSGAVDPTGPASGTYRVFRGGSWYSSAYNCRAAYRLTNVEASTDNEYGPGFRSARSSVPAAGGAGNAITGEGGIDTRSVTVIFSPPVPSFGAVTGGGSYAKYATATLTATPSPGYLFTGWTGDATGTDSPLSVLMDADRTITANFTPDTNDTDGDGWTNYQEIVVYGTDPTKKDTDGDGVIDSLDAFPLDPAEWLDSDHDGIGDNADPDDDGDGLSDVDEINIHHTDPKRADSDGDGLSDPDELQVYLTNPMNPDMDNDGLKDGAEVNIYHTLPKVADTDGDGFLDGYEVLTGKSPINDQDKPALVAEARTAIELTFPAASGKTYRIEASPDLATWTTVEDGIAGNGSVIQRFYTTRDMPKRYFRVEESAP